MYVSWISYLFAHFSGTIKWHLNNFVGIADVLRQENSIVQNKFFCTLKKKNALGKNIMHSLKHKLLELVTTATVKPVIPILKCMSKWYKKKGVPQNEMSVCLISEHQLPPSQLELSKAPLTE